MIQGLHAASFLQEDKKNNEKLGISGGFMSTIMQSDGTNGVKLNLNYETIQSIFKTYPAGAVWIMKTFFKHCVSLY